jgi:hypothetical protein
MTTAKGVTEITIGIRSPGQQAGEDNGKKTHVAQILQLRSPQGRRSCPRARRRLGFVLTNPLRLLRGIHGRIRIPLLAAPDRKHQNACTPE